MQQSLFFLFTIFFAVFSGASQAVTLDALLAGMTDSADVRALDAERKRLAIENEYRIEERGWSVFGGADMGYINEIQPGGDLDSYGGYGVRVGLRYPLMGTLDKRNEAVTDSELALIRQKHETLDQRSTQRFFLRQSYIDWWHASAISGQCEQWRAVAANELASARERAGQQSLRTSELQWLEQRWDRVMRSCESSERHRLLLRERTGRLSGAALTQSAEPERPSLADRPAPLTHWWHAINKHPTVEARKRALETIANDREDHWSDRIDSNFTISQQLNQRLDTAGTGSGLVAAVTFEVPLAALAGNHHESPGKAQYRATRERLTAERDQWRLYLEDNLIRYHDALNDVSEAIEQLSLASRLLQERQQRLALDSESGYMALRTARLEEIEAHLNLYRAWRGALKELAGLMRVAEHGDKTSELLGDEVIEWPGDAPAPLSNQEPVRAVYLWESQPLLGSSVLRQGHLQALAKAGFNQIYLGLNSRQVRQPKSLQSSIAALVREARDFEIRVDLLLGDPLWLTEEHREDLSHLIRQLSDLPFAGLHLDLEVEQLGWPVPERRLRQWIKTVNVAVDASPWPVTLVSHHRWFTGQNKNNTCVPCRLSEIGIREVSLMIYTTRTERAVELMDVARQQWPQLSFRLAQSVESTLPDSQSWHSLTLEELAGIEESFGHKDIFSIEWQDWRNHPAYPGQPEASHPRSNP